MADAELLQHYIQCKRIIPGRSVTMNDDDLSSMVEIVDALFRILAEEAAGREGVTFEEATKERGLYSNMGS